MISNPFGLATSSSSTVRSQYSKTKCNFCFRLVLNTSIKFTRFSCLRCFSLKINIYLKYYAQKRNVYKLAYF